MTDEGLKMDRKGTRVLIVVFALVCVLGLVTSVSMNLVNRSLWLDEASLSVSFLDRSLANLWDGPFEGNQTAPLGWLYVTKLITVIFGTSEFALRLGSVLFYLLTIGAVWLAARKIFEVPPVLAAAAAALFANITYVLEYSNEFKPYIAEGFFVLLVLLAFHAYRKGKIKAWLLALIWAVLIWFSNPVCFLEGGCLLVEGIRLLRAKNRKGLLALVGVGAAILASFAVYYFFWLKPVATRDGMQSYWNDYAFPLIPTSKTALVNLAKSVYRMFRGFGLDMWVMLPLTVLAAVYVLVKRKAWGLYILAGLFVALVASWLHFFPVMDRLWLFLIPLDIVFCFGALADFCASLLRKGQRLPAVLLGLVLPVVLVVAAWGIPTYLGHPERVYRPGEEVNSEIAYVRDHIQPGDQVYVFRSSVNTYQYRMGKENRSLGGMPDNVILGDVHFAEHGECDREISRLLEADRLWIISSHVAENPERLSLLMEALQRNGHLELAAYPYESPLWYYCRNREEGHLRFSLTVEGSDAGACSVRIRNEGPAWLNHDYETVRLLDRTSGTRVDLPRKKIAPGEEVVVTIKVDAAAADFDLVNDEGSVGVKGASVNE